MAAGMQPGSTTHGTAADASEWEVGTGENPKTYTGHNSTHTSFHKSSHTLFAWLAGKGFAHTAQRLWA
jgi:hypothetical protein